MLASRIAAAPTVAGSGVPQGLPCGLSNHVLVPSCSERVRHYRPSDQSSPLPCLYWIHGGGHVLGQIEQDDPMMDHIVQTVGCAALSVDWRRPPEHPFPAPMNDCYAGLRWTYHNATELRVDPDHIAIGGASSGGGIGGRVSAVRARQGRGAHLLAVARLPDARRPHEPACPTPYRAHQSPRRPRQRGAR